MSDNATELIKRGDRLFSAREWALSLWQELAEQFWPEQADFTSDRSTSTVFADHLITAEPPMMARDFASALAWLRAEDRDWFKLYVDDERIAKDKKALSWLEDNTKVMRRVLYKRGSQFNRSMKQGERGWSVFGNAVTSVELNQAMNGIKFTTHHLRDCAWGENADGHVDTLDRKIQMTARQIAQYFTMPGDKLHENIRKCLEKDQDKDKSFEVRHVMMPAKDYDYERRKGKKMPWVSCYVDVANKEIIREAGAEEFRYVVPRWETIWGSVYAVSPAAIVALPEARMLQALALIVQDAGEKAASPPLKAIEDRVRGNIMLRAGDITWVDTRDYDSGKMGPIVEPLYQAKEPGIGIELFERSKNTLAQCWFLNKLALPENSTPKTATEIMELIEERIRMNVPITEPVKDEYYDPVLDITASILFRVGAFGPFEEIPEVLRKRDLAFEFSNPLSDAVERARVQQFHAVTGIVGAAKAIDPASPVDAHVNLIEAVRDATAGTGAPADWLVDEDEANEIIEERAKQQAEAAKAQQIGGAAQVAEQVGNAGQALGLIEGGKAA